MRRVRRCELICPASALKMMQKAASFGADESIFDLEDACAPSEKVASRALVVDTFLNAPFTPNTIRAYRINGVHTSYCYSDLIDVVSKAGARIDVIVVPKVNDASAIEFVDTLLTQIEMGHRLEVGRIRIEALIETPQGVVNSNKIARSSARLDSLIFGVADYAGAVGMRNFRDAPYTAFAYARANILNAARANNLDAIDGVTVDFKNIEKLKDETARAAEFGFDGKWAIHPSQVEVIHEAFCPSASEVEHARKVVTRYEQANKSGQGAIEIGGEMIDAATLTLERRKIEIDQRLKNSTLQEKA